MNIKTIHVLKKHSTTVDVDGYSYDTAQKFIDYIHKFNWLDSNGFILPHCHDKNNDRHLTIGLYELYPDEAEKELQQLFLESLEDVISKNDNEYVISQYWHYDDEISPSTMQSILNNFDKDLTLEDHILNFIIENNSSFDDKFSFSYHWQKFINLYPEYDLDQFQDTLEEWFYENIKFDYDIQTLINNSKPDDLTLYFGTNWDDDYLIEASWQEYEGERLATIDLEKFINDVKDTQIAWLIQSQGYKLIDVFDKDKWKDSKFLQSIHSELYDYVSDLNGLQLIAIPDSTNWEAIMNLKFNKTGIIKAGTSFGLFNRIHGSGSGLCITTEKDIVLNNAENLYDVQIQRIDQPYFYSPDATYGLARTNKEQLEVLHDK